jgi:polyketide cyclase/dehydrase/lipid transport protein
MFTVTVTREVPGPVGLAWQVFTDLAHRDAWLSTVEAVTSLTGGTFGVGTRWRETRPGVHGVPVTEELVVIECTPGRHCLLELAGDGADYQLGFTFAPVDHGWRDPWRRRRGGSTVTAVLVGRPVSRTSRLLRFFLGGFAAQTVAGALRADLDALARECTRLAVNPADPAGGDAGRDGDSVVAA